VQYASFPFFTPIEMNLRVLDNGYVFPLEYDQSHGIVPKLFTIDGAADLDDCDTSANLQMTKAAMKNKLNIPLVYDWIARTYAKGLISIYVPAPGGSV